METDFHFAIDAIVDLAAILLECKVNKVVNLHDLDEYDASSCNIRIIETTEEFNAMDKALLVFSKNLLEYDLGEMIGEDDTKDMAKQVEALRKELYKISTSEMLAERK